MEKLTAIGKDLGFYGCNEDNELYHIDCFVLENERLTEMGKELFKEEIEQKL